MKKLPISDDNELQAGDHVTYDIVVGKDKVQGHGRVTGRTKAGPLIQPSRPLPNGARLENIQKVAR